MSPSCLSAFARDLILLLPPAELDTTEDEVVDIDNLASVEDAPGDADAPPAPAPAEGGGQWGQGAVAKLSGTALQLSGEQVTALAKTFSTSMDADGDGQLDLEEFTKQLTALGKISPLLAKRLFAVFDKDSSGSIDWQEFLGGLSACCEGSVTDKMTLCFSLYDLDEDGYLVPDELEQMLRA